MSFKNCRVCHTDLPRSDFYKLDSSIDGLKSSCKKCDIKNARENRIRKIGYYSEKNREYKRRDYVKQKSAEARRTEAGKAKRREQNKRILAKYPERKRAQNMLTRAIRKEEVIRQPCFVCGDKAVEGHHPDYSSPLDVVWLCHPHHSEIHSSISKITNLRSSKVGEFIEVEA